MFIMGSLYASGTVHASHGSARWVVVVMIYLFAMVFSATWAVGFRVYVSEIQSPKTRAGAAASLSLSANWVSSISTLNARKSLTQPQIMNWIVAFTTPIFLAHSTYGVYLLFGGASLLVAIVCVFFMPETRGKSLEDIDASFRGKTVDATVNEAFVLEDIDKSVERDQKTRAATASSLFA
jgi:hypothetical protein